MDLKLASLASFLYRELHRLLTTFAGLYWRTKTQIFYRIGFGAIGSCSRIVKPLALRNTENIFIGKRVIINRYTWLLTLQEIEGQLPNLTIGDDCRIGHFNHITCVNHVEIGKNVLTADRVHISDNSHGYADPRTPIIHQRVISKGPVIIGEGTWIGENVSVLSCRIGRNCVIGANAVVTRDIPDFCLAVGAPARVVKRFDFESGLWIRVENGLV